MIRFFFISDPDPHFLPIPNLESTGQKGTGSRIPDPDPQHCKGLQCLGPKGTLDYSYVYVRILLDLACHKLWQCTLLEQKNTVKEPPRSYPLCWNCIHPPLSRQR
jgi:hypothetical protein